MSRYEENGRSDSLPGAHGRFLLFSLTRCGSTTLRRLLNCHPRIRCLEEPFNPFNYDGKYFKRATDIATLDETLRDIWSTYNGIKHTWCPDGWPFPDNGIFNASILSGRGQKVLFLRRRNFLRRLVSVHISNQTGIWGLFNPGDRKKVENCKFDPMEIEATRFHLDCEKRMLSRYRRLLLDTGSTFMELGYEDIYDPTVTSQGHIESLNRIFAFLGETPITEESTLLRVSKLFDPWTMKLNSLETYQRIPGIEELDRRCGSDETGWIFKDQTR